MAGLHSTTGTTCKRCTNHSFRIKTRLLARASHFDVFLMLIKQRVCQTYWLDMNDSVMRLMELNLTSSLLISVRSLYFPGFR